MNPFDFKAVLFAKHAQHVVLVHFPIALCLTGVAFDFLARWTRRGTLAAAAYLNILAAAVAAPLALATGLLAWRWQLEGQRLRGVLLLHLVLAGISSGMIWLVWWLHHRLRRRARDTVPGYLLAVELLAVSLIAVTAHLGGFLSGVNVPG